MAEYEKIGIIGGTFNPIHTGHLIIAEQFSREIELDKCLFIPANISPFKNGGQDEQSVSAEHRMNMVRLAIEGNNNFEVEEYEIKKGGVSYTYETVHFLREKYPGAILYLLIGGDQVEFFNLWRNWMDILDNARLCIAQRPFTISDAKKQFANEILEVNGIPPKWLTTPLIEISSTKIRERIRVGKTIKYLVPYKVEQYILKHNLYKLSSYT